MTPWGWVHEHRQAKAIKPANGAMFMSLVTVGQQLSLAKEGVRLIKSRTLANLRSSGRRTQLAFWWGARPSHWRWGTHAPRTASACEPQSWSAAVNVRSAGDTR